MNNLLIYCLSLNNEDLDKIKSLNYIPVGLGDKKFSSDWTRDNIGENISNKTNITVNIHFIIGSGKINHI